MFLMVKIWSMHPLPFLNPACSSLSLLSIAESNLPRRIRQKTLDGTDRNVIPRQLSQNWRLPFFGSVTIRPFVQSSGMTFEPQTKRKKVVKILVDVSRSAFSISACIWSIPQAFPFFRALVADLTSCSLGGLISMSRRSSNCSMWAVTSGSGLLRTSRKCSSQRAILSPSVLILLPSLFFRGTDWLVFLPQSFLVIL